MGRLLGEPPAIAGQPYASAPERNALGLQTQALREHAADPGPRADPALRVDHAVPGESGRTLAHGPAHGARRARLTQRHRDLAVRHHAPARNAIDESPYRSGESQAGQARIESSHKRAYSPPWRNRSA